MMKTALKICDLAMAVSMVTLSIVLFRGGAITGTAAAVSTLMLAVIFVERAFTD